MCYNKRTIINNKGEKKMNALYALCAAGPWGYISDVVIVLVFFVFVFICGKRGFINVLFSFASNIVALFGAIALAKVFVSLTGGLFGLEGALTESFTQTFSKMNGFDVDVAGQDINALLSTGALPALIATLVVKKYSGVTLEAGTTLGMLAGSTVAGLLCSLISGVVLFILLKILIKLLKKIFNLIAKKINLVGKINRILGVLVGFIEGVLIISLVVSILALIPSAAISNFFNNSLILRLLYNHNPIVWMLGWFI